MQLHVRSREKWPNMACEAKLFVENMTYCSRIGLFGTDATVIHI